MGARSAATVSEISKPQNRCVFTEFSVEKAFVVGASRMQVLSQK